jgi:DNA-binding MarR family transcriptional regulator
MDLRQMFDDLVHFETVLWNTVDARLQQECGVPLGSLNVMLVIAAQPACRVQDIAAALAITVGGTSQSVDRLVARGHCRRRPNPGDRRSSIVELTPAGQDVVTTAGVVLDQQLEAFFRAPLAEQELRPFGAVLSTLRAAALRDSRERPTVQPSGDGSGASSRPEPSGSTSTATGTCCPSPRSPSRRSTPDGSG